MIRERFDVAAMTCKDMFNNHFSISTSFKTSATKNGDKFLVTKCKPLSFSAEHKYDIGVSQTMSDTVTNRFRLLKPGVAQMPDPVQPLYVAQLAIKEAKVKDVKALSQYPSPVALAQQFIQQY